MDNTRFVLLDDGVLTNLTASGYFAALAKGSGITFATLDSKCFETIPSEVVQWKNARNELDAEMLVDLCREIECDEASAVLVAHKRGCRLASDEARVHDCWERIGGASELIWDTPRLIQNWGEQTDISFSDVADAIRAIKTKALFQPSARCALFAWWSELSES